MPSLPPHETTQNLRWHSFPNAAELERTATNDILHCAHQAIDARGAFHIVLAGGTTPRKVYEALRHARTRWEAWHVYFGDERCLPGEHGERNSRMAALAWLDHVTIPATQIHVIPAELGAAVAAEKYARVVDEVRTFDLVLLGLGEDGHTASLFPAHEMGTATDAPSVLPVYDAPKPPAQRVSLSAHRLSLARQVIFLVSGTSKAQAVKHWRTGNTIPAAVIAPANGVDAYIEDALLD